jgi:hypothetical protein
MYIIQEVLVGDEVLTEQFVCHLEKCKGACCVEGDFGAPLDEEEIPLIEQNMDEILAYLDAEGRTVLENEKIWEWYDKEDRPFKGTKLRKDGACAFVFTEPNGVVSCGIERAWKAGSVNFKKPISCHLYPLRYSEIENTTFRALNYDEWSVCSPACQLGATLKVPLTLFLKEAIVRKFGDTFYEELEAARLHRLESN